MCEPSANKSRTVLLLGGAAAGFVGGLLGAGGGIILIYLLAQVMAGRDRRDMYATALAATIPMSALSVWRYARAGALDWGVIAPLLLPGLVGGLVGAWLLDRIRPRVTRRIFGALVLVSGAIMLLRR